MNIKYFKYKNNRQKHNLIIKIFYKKLKKIKLTIHSRIDQIFNNYK